MLQLNKLEKITQRRKRVGRGGHHGGHCGRGKDGQKSRTGSTSEIRPFFEGGQMSLTRRVPRRGFTNIFKKEYYIVNLKDLEIKFESGQIVDRETLREQGLIKGKNKVRIKVLGEGLLTKNLIVNVDAVSGAARLAIQNSGGSVNATEEKSSGGVTS